MPLAAQTAQPSGKAKSTLRPFSQHIMIGAWLIVGAWLFAGILPAAAQTGSLQDVSGLQYELNRLRQDVADLQRQMANQSRVGGAAAITAPEPVGNETAAARLKIQIDQMALELRNLTGQIEQIDFRLMQTQTRLDKLVADIDFRLSALEKGKEGVAGGSIGSKFPGEDPSASREAAPAANPAAPATTTADQSPEAQYAAAFNLLRGGDYPAAASALKAFLAAHPDHKLAGNAIYWLGETFYVRNQYQEAASYFLEGFQKYPDSPKGADNMLKLGMTLAALGHQMEACQTLTEIGKTYPQASDKIKNRATSEAKKANCR
ncbi:MAG TPA: tol-pal system protein YbgF [Alphaproteobacteria bacterium]|nr:tol-pal system protein YbgF [Alphaproteobacteria bacterium]